MEDFMIRPGVNRNAFTLIELLIVIVIIGILAGLVLVVVNPARQQRKSQESVLRATANKVCLALFSCAQTTVDARSCDTDNEIGIVSPNGKPIALTTYALSSSPTPTVSTSAITMTATLPEGTGQKNVTAGVDTCVYTCIFNFGTYAATNLTQSGTNCY